MKKYITLLLIVLAITSCSSDYLNTSPTNKTKPGELYASTENAKAAINGMAKLMIRQYQSSGFNGEGTIKMYYGNYQGQHFYKNLPGWAKMQNMDFTLSSDNTYTTYPWHYYYMLIGNANPLIEAIDFATGKEEDRLYIKAQALTFRAYAYMQLNQIYGQRWSDSDDGNNPSVVLRIKSGSEPIALSSQNDVYKQIYKDLDDAIEMFEASGVKRRSEFFYEPNLDVAHAVYARAAITKGDHENAVKHAQLASKNYPLMSNDQYKSGFSTPNSEWIWGSYNAPDETLHYWSFYAYIGYNTTASAGRNTPCIISRVLFNKIPETDIRKELFLNPGDDYIPTNNGLLNEAKGKAPEDAALAAEYRTRFPDIESDAKMYKYMQFKFKATAHPGVGNLNHFRSAEMYLIEAEALHKLGKDSEAQIVLNKLTQPRDPNYNCTKTGDELFEEIKTYRAIELWGEGFDWFDLKRWGDDRVRNSYKTKTSTLDDALYDQFPNSLDKTISPQEQNQWAYAIPKKESDYNPAI